MLTKKSRRWQFILLASFFITLQLAAAFFTTKPASADITRNLSGCYHVIETITFKANQTPPLYSIFRNPDLANTLRILAKKGRDAYYKGEIAKAIVAKEQKLGGVMTLADLSEFLEYFSPPGTDPPARCAAHADRASKHEPNKERLDF